ncbi:MAG: TIM barrel protein [Paracoccaceae bacterium]
MDRFAAAKAAGFDGVEVPNLSLQFDAYHAHRITGDALAAWGRHGHRAAHVQIAGYPGRREPLDGAIGYPAFFAQLDADDYRGRVSAEYDPAAGMADGPGWMNQQT